MLEKFIGMYVTRTPPQDENTSARQRRLFTDVVVGLVGMLIVVLVESLFVMLLWNAIVPSLLQSRTLKLSFGQALALRLLVIFLF
jgi:preprotein translocase subunit Sss1